MNRKDRQALASLVAEWEWGSAGGSASEAAALGRCARTLVEQFGLSDDDLNFNRAWVILGMATRDTPRDEDLDALTDLFSALGNEAVGDFIEENGFDGLLVRLRAQGEAV